jgi:putative membrane-bound dehydrogenase-like protein
MHAISVGWLGRPIVRITVPGWLIVFSLFSFCYQSNAQPAGQNHQETPFPSVLLDGWKLQLIDLEPSLVTPVSCRFDTEGNLFVVECHTHFPPEDYAGPDTDRIFVYRDRQDDGRFQRRQIFHEGGRATMGLAVSRDGWVYVATREKIVRMRDTTGDGQADLIESLIRHETSANYPHNGLSGLAVSDDGYLYFGQGENFGEPFTISGSDGSRQIGSGEGGNVYRCRLDGSQIERIATGIWNPFGLCLDQWQRLWCVDNDPDARPPCRLLHIVPQADYGFQFRFGRAGTNPLLAWDGELPGTLPMAAGTGEAPCEVLAYGEHLWVTSWGDNRIERYRLNSRGATLQGEMEIVVQGKADFRPVSFAVADDGSIYFTDWVDRSYPVHGRGRLWRLVPDRAGGYEPRLPPPSPEERMAGRLLSGQATEAEFRTAVQSPDAFLRNAAGAVLGDQPILELAAEGSAVERLERLRVARWKRLAGKSSPEEQRVFPELLRQALQDSAMPVRLLAIRAMAEQESTEFAESLESRLRGGVIEADEFNQLVAAISFLKTGSAGRGRRDPARDQLMADLFSDPSQPIELRGLALRNLPAQGELIDLNKIVELLRNSSTAALHREILALLSQWKQPEVTEALHYLLLDRQLDCELRADVLAVLASDPEWVRQRWNQGLKDALKSSLEVTALDLELQRIENSINYQTQGVKQEQPLPHKSDLEGWYHLVGDSGDVKRGWRVWMRSQCVQCHAMHGRGASVGPELSTLATSGDRRRSLQSIVDPSREVAPMYAAWQILTTDGRILTGAKLNESGAGTQALFLAADGSTFEVALDEIESQRVSSQSIMPESAIDSLALDELADLLEFLTPSNR